MMVGLMLKKKGWQYFSLLELFPAVSALQAEENGWCEQCKWVYYCYPIVFSQGGEKLCTLDFRKKYMPKFNMKELL